MLTGCRRGKVTRGAEALDLGLGVGGLDIVLKNDDQWIRVYQHYLYIAESSNLFWGQKNNSRSYRSDKHTQVSLMASRCIS